MEKRNFMEDEGACCPFSDNKYSLVYSICKMLRWIRSRRDRLCFYAARQFILGQCAPYSVISPWVAAIICLYMERQFIFGTVYTVFPSCYYSICTLYTTVVISPWVKLLICLSIPPCVMCVWRRGNGGQKISPSHPISPYWFLLLPHQTDTHTRL